MYELYVLNKLGQQSYGYTGDDLGDTIEAAKNMLEKDGYYYAYIIEKVLDARGSAAFFNVRHVWFSTKQEKEDDDT